MTSTNPDYEIVDLVLRCQFRALPLVICPRSSATGQCPESDDFASCCQGEGCVVPARSLSSRDDVETICQGNLVFDFRIAGLKPWSGRPSECSLQGPIWRFEHAVGMYWLFTPCQKKLVNHRAPGSVRMLVIPGIMIPSIWSAAKISRGLFGTG